MNKWMYRWLSNRNNVKNYLSDLKELRELLNIILVHIILQIRRYRNMLIAIFDDNYYLINQRSPYPPKNC